METPFKVESGIPFCGKYKVQLRRVPLEQMYPFKQMAVGDSFFVPAYTIRIPTVQVAISRVNKRGLVDGVYKHLPVVENSVAGSRVWRIA